MGRIIPTNFRTDPAPDIADPEQAARFPRHGWARSTHGNKLMWRPMMRLAADPEAWRRERGMKELRSGEHYNANAFYQTLRHLTVALRDLHRLSRPLPLSAKPKVRAMNDIRDSLAVLVDIVYVYLRRLADRMAEACRLVFFEHHQSAPRTFKELRRLIGGPQDALRRLGPVDDADRLRTALLGHSSWYDRLTQLSVEKGFRDTMEHRPVVLMALFVEENDALRPFVFLQSGHPSQDPRYSTPDLLAALLKEDLITGLRPLVADLSDLMTGLCECVRLAHGYILEDYAYLVVGGEEDDVTGFWPEI